MKRALGLALSVLAAACTPSEVVVSVLPGDVAVPDEVDQVSITVSNPHATAQGSGPIYTSPLLSLCPGATGATGATGGAGCYRLPLSVTLFPGARMPDDSVRVQVDAYRQSMGVISDAAIFTFSGGTQERLDFPLYKSCLSRTVGCGASNRVCSAAGDCVDPLAPVARGDLGAGTITRTWVSSGTAGMGAPTIVPRPDSAEPGDLVVVQLTRGQFDFTAPAGWREAAFVNTGAVTNWLYHVVPPGETGDYDFGLNAGNGPTQWGLLAYRNVAVIDSSQLIAVTNTQPSATVTVGRPDSLEVFVFAQALGCASLAPLTPVTSNPFGVFEHEVPVPAVTGPWQFMPSCDFTLSALVLVLSPRP